MKTNIAELLDKYSINEATKTAMEICEEMGISFKIAASKEEAGCYINGVKVEGGWNLNPSDYQMGYSKDELEQMIANFCEAEGLPWHFDNKGRMIQNESNDNE